MAHSLAQSPWLSRGMFLWTRRTSSGPQKKSIRQYQLKLPLLQKGPADTPSAEEANIPSIDKCLIGRFENQMSCMQMQMLGRLFTVSSVPDRLQCQASAQPPIILLGSASRDAPGLSEPCKFPHPKAHLCFRSWFLLPPWAVTVHPLPISVAACPGSEKALEKWLERKLFQLCKV